MSPKLQSKPKLAKAAHAGTGKRSSTSSKSKASKAISIRKKTDLGPQNHDEVAKTDRPASKKRPLEQAKSKASNTEVYASNAAGTGTSKSPEIQESHLSDPSGTDGQSGVPPPSSLETEMQRKLERKQERKRARLEKEAARKEAEKSTPLSEAVFQEDDGNDGESTIGSGEGRRNIATEGRGLMDLLEDSKRLLAMCGEDPSLTNLDQYFSVAFVLNQKFGIKLADPRDALGRRGGSPSGADKARSRPGIQRAGAPHFSDVPGAFGPEDTFSSDPQSKKRQRQDGPSSSPPKTTSREEEEPLYRMDASGNYVQVVRTASSSAADGRAAGASEGSGGDASRGELQALLARKPYEVLGNYASEAAVAALSRNSKLALSRGGHDILSYIMNLPSNQGGSGGGCCDIQIETAELINAALNPSSTDLDRFGSLGLGLTRDEAKDQLRPFRNGDKKARGLGYKKTVFNKVVELEAATGNYIELLDAVLMLKPEILSALREARGWAIELAENSPHTEQINRAIVSFYFQEVQDILRTAGASSAVGDIESRISDINFYCPSSAHSVQIQMHHLHQFTIATGAAAAAPIAAASGVLPPATGAGSAGISKSARDRAKKAERKQAANAAAAAAGTATPAPTPGGGAIPCVWFCSTSGCDPTRRRDGRPCKAHKHVLPTKEAARLQLLASMAKLSLTARADFPSSCPP